MRVTCKCGSKLVVSKQTKVSDTLSHFYGDCSACGERWRGSTTLDHVVESDDIKLRSKLLNFFDTLTPKDKKSLVNQLDPS